MITEERILHHHQKYQASGSVHFTDLFDEHHQPSGTKVDVTILYI